DNRRGHRYISDHDKAILGGPKATSILVRCRPPASRTSSRRRLGRRSPRPTAPTGFAAGFKTLRVSPRASAALAISLVWFQQPAALHALRRIGFMGAA